MGHRNPCSTVSQVQGALQHKNADRQSQFQCSELGATVWSQQTLALPSAATMLSGDDAALRVNLKASDGASESLEVLRYSIASPRCFAVNADRQCQFQCSELGVTV